MCDNVVALFIYVWQFNSCVEVMSGESDSSLTSEREEKKPVQDLEIKDASLIFNSIWQELAMEAGGEQHLKFSKEIFWLNGAPGAGKGTHTKFIMKYKELYEAPIVVSELLKSEEARKRMDAGILAGDKEVINLVLRKLLDPIYEDGAIVDGYPRTMVQVECLKLFHNKLSAIRAQKLAKSGQTEIKMPHFHIVVLFIDEDESVKRQLHRGQLAKEHNDKVKSSGMGELISVRNTDMDATAARNRYRTFKEVTYDSLKSLQKVFHYHYINAHGSIKEIQDRIIEELQYQSSLELAQKTFDSLTVIPIATDIVRHARQQLVKRLDDYQANHKELFDKVISYIKMKFMPIIKRHAISGFASVNTEDTLFDESIALAMLIDIFSERGYHVSVDVRREEVPTNVDLKTGKITCTLKKVYRVNVKFGGSVIRRGR